ncbi:MAG: glycosyltransferase family 39 protein [Pseudomonadota bacterium]
MAAGSAFIGPSQRLLELIAKTSTARASVMLNTEICIHDREDLTHCDGLVFRGLGQVTSIGLVKPQSAIGRFSIYWPYIIVAYFALNAVLRVLLTPTLTQDEAQQLVFAQSLRLGYDEQPPLYTWVLYSLFAVFGPSLVVLTAIKAILLSSAFLFAYSTGRMIAGPVAGMMASASLFLVPQIGWEMQRDLTHTVLVFIATVALVYFLVAAYSYQRPRAYVGIALALAVGLLAKQLFFLAAIPLLLALPVVKDVWSRFNKRWLLYALAFGLCAAAPFYVWQIFNIATSLQDTAKFGLISPGDGALAQRWRGLGAIFEGIVSTLAIPFAIWLVMTLGFRGRRASGAIVRFLFIATLLSLALIVVSVLVAGASSLRIRYFVLFDYPVLLLAPLVFLVCVKHKLLYWLLPAVAVTGAAVISVGLVIGFRFAPALDIPNRLQIPFVTLIDHLNGQGCHPEAVFAKDNFIGGNVRLQLPTVPVSAPAHRVQLEPEAAQSLLLIWSADSPEQEARVVALAESAGQDLPPPKVETVTLPLLFSTSEQDLTHSFAFRCHGYTPKPLSSPAG